ncbi:MAG TPA: F420-0--gamma-glutamyl ligase [bacterium]|nr:F420-0--gamma-glutamyl ligase [bacterium]HPL95225.1 F420-0--gamma-glutamyl ligase [bacterium]
MSDNLAKNLIIKVGDREFSRYPLKTHLITKDDQLADVIEKYVLPVSQIGDMIVMSERMVAITQGRLIHESEIKASFLAKFLIKFVKKWPNDPGFRNAKKMQVAINMIGYPRILLAALVSALTKPFGIRGLFYKICGHEVAEIDGFAQGTIPPYDQYAVLGPKDPAGVCEDLKQKFNLDFAIVDANNIDVAILGTSKNFPLTHADLRLAFIDNPIGQGLEQTPICIVREKV